MSTAWLRNAVTQGFWDSVTFWSYSNSYLMNELFWIDWWVKLSWAGFWVELGWIFSWFETFLSIPHLLSSTSLILFPQLIFYSHSAHFYTDSTTILTSDVSSLTYTFLSKLTVKHTYWPSYKKCIVTLSWAINNHVVRNARCERDKRIELVNEHFRSEKTYGKWHLLLWYSTLNWRIYHKPNTKYSALNRGDESPRKKPAVSSIFDGDLIGLAACFSSASCILVWWSSSSKILL